MSGWFIQFWWSVICGLLFGCQWSGIWKHRLRLTVSHGKLHVFITICLMKQKLSKIVVFADKTEYIYPTKCWWMTIGSCIKNYYLIEQVFRKIY